MIRDKALRVLLVDDHTLVRAGIRSLLEGKPGIEIVAEADNGRDAALLVNRYAPDVVIMDISMRELNGIDANSVSFVESQCPPPPTPRIPAPAVAVAFVRSRCRAPSPAPPPPSHRDGLGK